MQNVIYRTWHGEVFAILPGLPANFGNVVIYAHNGQHSEADSSITSAGKLANSAEYAALHKELNAIYDRKLVIKKRVQYSQIQKGWNHADRA